MKRLCYSLKLKSLLTDFYSIGRMSILLLFLTVVFTSCENTEMPSRALQANLNGNLFRAYSVEAFADNETQMIRIEATSDYEKFILHTEWNGPNTYKIGSSELNYAIFENAEGTILSTESEGSSGAITITNFNDDIQEFSGNFNFTFVTATDTISVSQGFFHAVPYVIVDGFDN